jgi:CRISPR-associated endonuclease Csn1
MNKTLCSKRFNREIKRNKMPIELANYEAILSIIEPWKKKYLAIEYEIKSISRAIKAASTKEQKDRKIRLRHKLNLQKDYFKGKYERFTYTEPKVGFKNSQIPDTGVITKYARAYLKSYFERVESVKGGMVAEFRKAWGIQESYTENGKKYYEVKDRSKHTHHCIDAITIACMTKDKYDVMANSWGLEDDINKNQYKLMKSILEESKPWKTFTEDLKKIEDEILVSHHTPDNVKKQSKKIVRIRGKKQFRNELLLDIITNNPIPATGKRLNEKVIVGKSEGKDYFKIKKNIETFYYEYLFDKNKNIIHKKVPIYEQGDTIRGSLHQDSIYGAIKNPLNQEEIKYVIRKSIEDIKATDIENIVDEVVKQKIKEAKENKVLIFSSNAQQKNKLDGTVWMNKEKGIPINKVRLYANSVKNPLHIKAHSDLSKSRHEHKQKVYGQNDENYCMAIYELDGKRDFELINNFDLAKLIKAGQGYYPLNKEKEIKGKKVQFPIAKSNNRDVVLKRGQQVIFYDNEIEKPKDITELIDFNGRIYIIEGLSIQRQVVSGKLYEFGSIMFRNNKEARKADEIKKDNFKPDGAFKLGEIKPTRKMNHSQFSAFVEGIDFKVLPSGKFEKI